MFIPRAQPHAQSLFLFPIVFGINLIHFFDGKNNRVTWESRNKEGKFFWQQKVIIHCEFQRHNGDHSRRVRWEVWREKRKVRMFGKGKCKLIAKCDFLTRESVNSLPILALQWWRHFRLSLSLSLPHRAHLTHNIGSASYNNDSYQASKPVLGISAFPFYKFSSLSVSQRRKKIGESRENKCSKTTLHPMELGILFMFHG